MLYWFINVRRIAIDRIIQSSGRWYAEVPSFQEPCLRGVQQIHGTTICLHVASVIEHTGEVVRYQASLIRYSLRRNLSITVNAS